MIERYGQKPYHLDCLKAVKEFFETGARLAALGESQPYKAAYAVRTENRYGPYHDPGEAEPALAGVPSVCLRVPTGGGKTVLGCRMLLEVRNAIGANSHPFALWLVPTQTIRDQTLAAFKDRSHPYRQVLDEVFQGRVLPVDTRDALELSGGDLSGNAVILVTTFATARVEDMESRRFYRENGTLMQHFGNLPPALLGGLEQREDGSPVPSLANLIRMRRPLVLVDEAHNAKSKLSYTMLANVSPAAILELTATPRTGAGGSNVLHLVSASELHAAGMIKLPLLATEESDWKKCLAEAKAQREALKRIAEAEGAATGEYLRPIALIQAEKKNETLTVERVLEVLTGELEIPRERIAVETGEKSELTNVRLEARDCPIDYVVTIDKLREGWDCPFAYVLASVREMKSGTVVEQIVGRILRLPGARSKKHEELNRSYAFLRSSVTMAAISALRAALTLNGFEKWETEEQVKLQLPLDLAGTLFDPVAHESTPLIPAVHPKAKGWTMPLLAIEVDGEPEPLECADYLPATWDITACDWQLSEAEYSTDSVRRAVELSVMGEHITEKFVRYSVPGVENQFALLEPDGDLKDELALALWLDRNIRHPDIGQDDMKIFLEHLVHRLTCPISEGGRGLALSDLVRQRIRLRRAVAQKIDAHRAAAKTVAQGVLFESGELPGAGTVIFDSRVQWQFPERYDPGELYRGSYQFNKHAFPGRIGKMDGEEAECARALDFLPTVDVWLRNVERKRGSFRLPTRTDYFYPDYVARLSDSRLLALEYKGQGWLDSDDTKEKRRLGELWARGSGNVFLLVGHNDYGHELQRIGRPAHRLYG